jgi:hypothetical protein
VFEVALSGNLGFVPLDEVLRLLTRADQRGSVDVRGEDIRGRIFISKKGIALATTAEDRDLHKHLVNSAYVDDSFLRHVVSGDSTFSDLGDKEGAILELIREITIESLYRLTEKGATFEVAEGAVSPYGSPRPFELEATLDESRRRAEEWATVNKVIDDLDATIHMNRDVGDREEIKINREAWRLLCELGAGASVSLMAERLGTTEFWIAKVAAEMAEQQLLVLAEEPVEATDAGDVPQWPTEVAEDSEANESWWVEPEHEEQVGDTSELPAAAEAQTSDVAAEDVPAEPAKDSRFGHFVRAAMSEPTSPPPAAESFEPEPQIVEDEVDHHTDAPTFEPAAELEGVEEDTEAFLEKVFSQLEVNGQAEVEDEGHGLLRRRRMGSVLKEIDED